MAELTILTPEQVAERQQKPKGKGRLGRRRSEERTRIIEEYKAALQDAQPGYGADVFLSEDEVKRVVRQNLKAAAAEQNLGVEFRPIKDKSRLHIRFITLEEQAAKPKRGGGRPRKSIPVAMAEGEGESQAPAEAQPTDEQEQPATPKRRRTRKAESSAS